MGGGEQASQRRQRDQADGGEQQQHDGLARPESVGAERHLVRHVDQSTVHVQAVHVVDPAGPVRLQVVASPGHRVEVGCRDVIEVGDQDPPSAGYLEQVGPQTLGHHHRAELAVRLARGHLRVPQPPRVEVVAHAPGARDVQRDVVEEDVVPRTQPELVGGIRLDHDVSVVRGPGTRDEVDPPREVADAHGGDGAFLGGRVAAGTRQVDLAGDGAIHRPGRRQLRQRPGQGRSTCVSWRSGSSARSSETRNARSTPACCAATARAPSSTAASTRPTMATLIPHSSMAVPSNAGQQW